MRVLEGIFVLQAVTEDAVETGVGEHEPGSGEQEAKGVERNRKPFVVDQVTGPRAEAGICQIAEHAQVGGKEQQGRQSPRVVQSRKKQKGEAKKQEFFEFEQAFHGLPVGNWLNTVDNYG